MTLRNWIIRLLLVAVLLVVALQFGSAAPAAAQSTPHSYYWTMKFDFDGTFNGVLEVQYKFDPPDGVGYTVKRYQEIICNPIGRVGLTDGKAVFSGDGFLECQIPSIRDNVAELSGGITPGIVDKYDAIELTAQVAWEPGKVHPILAHMTPAGPDVQFSVLSENEDSFTFSQLHARFVNKAPTFGWMFPSRTGTRYDVKTQLVCNGTCEFDHTVDGQSWGEDPTTPDGIIFYLDPAGIYIGFDPTTGEFLHGQLDSAGVDPGNFVNVN